MKVSEPEPTMLTLLAIFLVFFSFSLGSLWWFVLNFSQLTEQVVSNARLIDFNRGAFYGLGCSVGMSALTFGGLWEKILKQPCNQKFLDRISSIMISGLFITFLLPHIAHYSIEYILEKRGYMICDTHSMQWSMYRSYYYVSDVDTCTNLIESKNY